MNYRNIMDSITNEAISRTQFYKELNICAENKDKLGFINKLVEKYNCNSDDARIVCEYFFDGTPFPSTLSPDEIAYNNAIAREWLNKPKCPTCGSRNLKKISTTSKVLNTAMFGILGTKRNRQFHCSNCGYEW